MLKMAQLAQTSFLPITVLLFAAGFSARAAWYILLVLVVFYTLYHAHLNMRTVVVDYVHTACSVDLAVFLIRLSGFLTAAYFLVALGSFPDFGQSLLEVRPAIL
jgi:succinate dehydrogenase hydrophobic anchor subunit